MVVLVTGADGQLGQALKAAAKTHKEVEFYFANSTEADITDPDSLDAVFKKVKPQFCINAAAYTAVDKAESESEKAFAINTTGAGNLARVCKENKTVLLHVSTDFVFDGNSQKPYTEKDITNPQSVYGTTKLQGELAIQDIIREYYIIRTSWVYSQYGHNFMKTMLRLAAERDSLNVVNDQTGTPTNANDLAEALITIINHTANNTDNVWFGVYNYSNEGQCTWFEFAKKIFEVNKITIDLQPIPTTAYPTPAKRPVYSVLDKTKIKDRFLLSVPHWESSLEKLS
ncbi:dTDP-4-dehydrorhamnose reductase [Flavobacterium sp. Sd200]|uniref:dTDP-4-dehydrorhamnose reductase n=1 Tax=Flavobacterium sp. Sd200 TaxID=2692211 RepID=UPI00136CF414|nr:dTDP-4-dehydrorhamnose reductase [Flavobacterium sp. Sd200]MXN92570.1 dTDP-4-dehydrorhamnose reductase [Flavobacterium sp. Sd200]